MERRARIIDRYTIEVIDLEAERKQIDVRFVQSISLGNLNKEWIQEIESKDPDTLTAKERSVYSRYQKHCQIYNQELEQLVSLLPFLESDPPELSPLDDAIPFYEKQDGVIIQRWETVLNVPHKVKAEIARVQSLIDATDYRIIKSYEYTLMGFPLPYDIAVLHMERQELRDRIGKLNVSITSKEVLDPNLMRIPLL